MNFYLLILNLRNFFSRNLSPDGITESRSSRVSGLDPKGSEFESSPRHEQAW